VIRVVLPAHLKNLAHVSGEVRLEVAGPAVGAGPVTQRLVLDALEAKYPMLLGTIRDRHSGKRRAFVRFYACEEDLSNEPPDAPLPERVIAGAEPLIILGAMAGG
jgi:molybdopterin synthase sulfur carrier subunit